MIVAKMVKAAEGLAALIKATLSKIGGDETLYEIAPFAGCPTALTVFYPLVHMIAFAAFLLMRAGD
jgi:hypothetical protein